MKSNPRLILSIASLLIAGCTAYEMPPLATSHPARTEAMGSPGGPPSRTLAYTQADIPSTRPVLAAAAPQGDQGTSGSAQHLIVAEGKVVATVPNASQIVVEHGEIKGFMEAMTMGYRVDPPSLLEGLKFGDKVLFTIDVPKKAIVKIEKLK
jgi:Cu/Ag efflux protein CusF